MRRRWRPWVRPSTRARRGPARAGPDEDAGRLCGRETQLRGARTPAARWGAAINLTAIREPAEVARRHVCDSLSAVPPLARAADGPAPRCSTWAAAAATRDCRSPPPCRWVASRSWTRRPRRPASWPSRHGRRVRAARRSSGLEPGRPRIEVIAERAEDLADDADSAPPGTSSRRARSARWRRSSSWACRSCARADSSWPGSATTSAIGLRPSCATRARSSAPAAAGDPTSSP